MRFLEGRPAWVAGMLMVALLVAGLSAAVLAQTDPAPPEPAAADETETDAPEVPGAGTEIWQPEVTAEPDPAADEGPADEAPPKEQAPTEEAPADGEDEEAYPQFPLPEDASLAPPQNVEAVDYPDDEGNQLLLNWELSPEDAAPPRPREFFEMEQGEYRFMSQADKRKRRREAITGAELAAQRERSGYVIRRKPTSQQEFLWEPDGEAGPFFEPVELPPGTRQYRDQDFRFLVRLGDDSVLRSADPPSPEELLELREDLKTLDPRHTTYDYEIRYFEDGRMSPPVVISEVRPRGNYFNSNWINVLLVLLVSSALILGFIYSARAGKELYVRPIAGLQAVDDAVGRATEMGRPVLFCPGFATVDNISTIAAMVILGRIARIAAEHGTEIIVPCRDPVVMTALREVVREAYMSVGRPEDYNEDRIFFLTDAQFAYAAGMSGIMLRERTAANFYMGQYFAESLILAETGFLAGSIQIVGTDSYTQLPFFIVACDYTLMGEEFFGASAYLSREPKLLGSLKGQDYSKLLIALFMTGAILVATIAGIMEATGVAEWVKELFQYATG